MTQHQQTLFDNANLHRKTDPETSQMAAAEIVDTGKLGKAQRRVLGYITRRCAMAVTAQEAAEACTVLFGGVSETYRKRVKELVKLGLIVECERRRCTVTGKVATTYRAK
jgi:hypothetical protein